MNARLIGYVVAVMAVVLVLNEWQSRGAQLTAARAELATCTAAREALDQQVTAQNAAIADYRNKAAAQQQAADAAQAQARAQIEQSQRRLQRILTARVPTECPAAMQWLGAYGRDLATRWEADR